MNDQHENKFTMYKAVVKLFDKYPDKIAGITALTPVIEDLNNKIQAITEKDVEANTSQSGNADVKAALRASLEMSALKIASALYALGAKNSDEKLKALSKVTKSSLNALRDTQLVSDVEGLKKLADSYKAELSAYGITAGMLTELETTQNSYNTSIGTREQGQALSSAAYKTLDQIFKETDVLLKEQADKIMMIFRDSDSQFYNEYLNTREIKDLGHRKEKPDSNPKPGNQG